MSDETELQSETQEEVVADTPVPEPKKSRSHRKKAPPPVAQLEEDANGDMVIVAPGYRPPGMPFAQPGRIS